MMHNIVFNSASKFIPIKEKKSKAPERGSESPLYLSATTSWCIFSLFHSSFFFLSNLEQMD